jgi:PAS domain S-box-containing protein
VIVYTNSKFEKMFGYEKGEIIGKHVSVVNAPEEKTSPRDIAEKIMKALNEKGEWRGEVKNIRKDSTTFWCLVVVSTFEHPDFGSVWISAHTNITTRKRVEEALRESEEKFREIFDNANDAIEIIELLDSGLPGRYLDLNDVACRMVLYTKEELLQSSPVKINTDYYSRPLDEIIRELHTTGHATFETEHKRKDGFIVPVEINTHKITLLGKTVLLSIVWDNTERKKGEAAIQQSELKFRDIFNNTTDAIHIYAIRDDGSSGRFTEVNDVTYRMLGYTKEEILVKTPLDIATDYHNPPH